MKWNALRRGVVVAWLLASTFSKPAECMRWMRQTPDDISNLSSECEKGQLASCSTLGIDYLTGRGVAKDENKARALLERACGGNDARGCNNLGNIFAGGLSVPKDEPRARCNSISGVAMAVICGRA
jgi:TPR repeat protein